MFLCCCSALYCNCFEIINIFIAINSAFGSYIIIIDIFVNLFIDIVLYLSLILELFELKSGIFLIILYTDHVIYAKEIWDKSPSMRLKKSL